MLLCTATIDGTEYQWSDRQLALATPWYRRILSFDASTIGLTKPWGGRFDISEGKITLSANFQSYPPPETIDMELRRWVSAETGDLLFIGTAYLEEFNQIGATYRLYAPAYTSEIADGSAFSAQSVVTFFTNQATALGLTLDSVGVRSPVPTITYTLTRDSLRTDLMASVAEFYSHIWWIDRDASVLYLRAIETNNGEREVGRRFMNPAYKLPAPTAEVITQTSTTTYRSASASGIGKSENVQRYHGTAATIRAALALILANANQIETEVTLPLEDGIPAVNEKVIWIDQKVTPNLEAYCFAQRFSFDFANQRVTISGKGGVAAI